MFSFNQKIEVPPQMIKEIVRNFRITVTKKLLSDNSISGHTIFYIDETMKQIQADFTSTNGFVCRDGWNLDDQTIFKISKCIQKGQKIAAIKEFRAVTGAGLKEGKEFIDRYPLTEEGADMFVNTFID
jgi:ribosomal protein L7/L12